MQRRRCACSPAPTASPTDDPRLMQAARATGADVPVCLDPRSRVMRGIGEILSHPLDVGPLPAVLVNPGVAVASKEVFAALGSRGRKRSEPRAGTSMIHPSGSSLRSAVPGRRNLRLASRFCETIWSDRQSGFKPVIAAVLAALGSLCGLSSCPDVGFRSDLLRAVRFAPCGGRRRHASCAPSTGLVGAGTRLG